MHDKNIGDILSLLVAAALGGIARILLLRDSAPAISFLASIPLACFLGTVAGEWAIAANIPWLPPFVCSTLVGLLGENMMRVAIALLRQSENDPLGSIGKIFGKKRRDD